MQTIVFSIIGQLMAGKELKECFDFDIMQRCIYLGFSIVDLLISCNKHVDF